MPQGDNALYTAASDTLIPDNGDLAHDAITPDDVMPLVHDMQRRFVPVRRIDGLFYALLIAALVVAAWLRFDAQNWDDFSHLHPDERFLTQVVSALGGPLGFTDRDATVREEHYRRCEARYPLPSTADNVVQSSFMRGHGGYFDADCSPLNPNNVGQGLYVYGEFPLFTVNVAGEARSQLSRDYHAFLEAFGTDAAAEHTITTYWEGYNGVQLVGRTVSALADWLTVIVLFMLGRRLYGRWTGLLAAALYAVAAFPIQQAHFWTVDAFTTFWVTLVLYCAVRVLDDAGSQHGPLALVYLIIWAGATTWDALYQSYPVLGLVTLGAIFLVTLGVLAGLRAFWGIGHQDGRVLAAAGVIASVIFLIFWMVLIVVARHEFLLGRDLLALGFASLIFAMAIWIVYLAAGVVWRHMLGRSTGTHNLAMGAIGLMWLGLVVGVLFEGLSPWATLLVAMVTVALLIFDVTELTDYALFGIALGGAMASRVNVAPLAGVIIVAAGIKTLPALSVRRNSARRNRIVIYAATGVATAAVLSFIVFRLLQPHAFLGPGVLDIVKFEELRVFGVELKLPNLNLNPGWREDISEAAHLTSGAWDAPPNHQWANRMPYFFPWRNSVLWGLGIPLGLVAWGGWAWAGVDVLRGRGRWKRHAIPLVWILVAFGWLGGRWVTTMRYFLPIYPALALFAAWALIALVRVEADRRVDTHDPVPGSGVTKSRLAVGGAWALLIGVLGYTIIYGFAFHTIHRQQLTRVAASRWFQENIPGDLGIWVERDDGTRQMINIGRGFVAPPLEVFRLEQGETFTFNFTTLAEARLTQINLNRLGDPAQDFTAETVRVEVFLDDPVLGRQLLYTDRLEQDIFQGDLTYSASYTLSVDDEVMLLHQPDASLSPINYGLAITVLEGGPVMFVRDVIAAVDLPAGDVSLGLEITAGELTFIDLYTDTQPLLTGHGDDIPSPPTHWAAGESTPITFDIPVDGVIRQVDIPHLGDPLHDVDVETLHLTLTGPDGTVTTVLVQDDFSAGANPLGLARTVIFDPPLAVQKYDAAGNRQQATLTLTPQDPVYTSGPVIAWEGSWDDPVPWPTCPLPDDVQYHDDLPSGLSTYDCPAVDMYNGHYQGLKLWMSAEDNAAKYQALTNALDQADYLVITSNRFYDTLSRIPMRWPMSNAFYAALFDGAIGFELIKTFERYPQLGSFGIPDQVLPTDDLPDFLNEHWEAEEAFHVYDHPTVLVFRKTGDYTPEKLRAVLDSVSLRPVSTASPGYVVDPDPVGVVPWGAQQASQSPTMLQLTPEKWDMQRAGGTWSELFDLNALINRNQLAAIVVWWLLMIGVGWITWPLLFAIMPALPDRAFPAAKITGWLIMAWVAWIGGTLNLLTWTRTGLVVILVGLMMLSLVVVWRQRAVFGRYIRMNWRYVLALEGLTLALFVMFLGVRQGNPDLWHGSFGGEKPMDFAYFNAVLRSTVFPPLNPWFSGDYINYYYFGYVLVGAPVKLLGLNPSVAYNLIIPTLYAMTGVGVFSIVYNWVRVRATTPGAVENATRNGALLPEFVTPAENGPLLLSQESRTPPGNAWLAGMLALLLAVVLGNLGTLHVIMTNVAALDGWQQPPLYHQARLTELEAQRSSIYRDFYDAEIRHFSKEHGHEPVEPHEMTAITQTAQRKTEQSIQDAAHHPSLYRLWAYELDTFLEQMRAFFNGVGQLIDGKSLPMASHRWYWAPTRIIAELPNGAGRSAIAEMPYFTFLYGDLHAHMLAFPITLLVLLWLLAEIMGAGHNLRVWWEAGLALGLGAVAVGVLRPTNSWDWITYLLLGAAGMTYVTYIGVVRATYQRPPSPAAVRLLPQLKTVRVQDVLGIIAGIVPVAVLARLAFYSLRKMQASQQATRGLRPGETLIDPTLTFSSTVLWIVAGAGLVVLFYVLVLGALRAHITRDIVLILIGRVALFVALTFVVALPFTMYFSTAYTAVKPWELETTPLWAYMYVHGTFVFIVVSFLIWQTVRWLRAVTVRQLRGLAVPVIGGAGGVIVIVLGAVIYGVREAAVAQLVIPLIVWALLLFFRPLQNPLLRVIYALIIIALAISLGVELVVLDGDIGRQNTVFKFYLQVWFMLSIVGGVVLAWMIHSARHWQGAWRGAWYSTLILLFSLALLYPILGTQARFQDRFAANETPLTLDGMAYMQHAVHGESGIWFKLIGDYEIIRWLQMHVTGTPVIMEAHLFPSEYHWGGRISIYTGLPTMLGWNFHQKQQHSLPEMDRLVQTRENNAAAFYELAGSEGIQTAMDLIAYYDIEYIVVGALERAFYDDIMPDADTRILTTGHSAGLAKFDQMVDLGMLTLEYSVPRCVDVRVDAVENCLPSGVYHDKIYHVVPGAQVGEEIAAGP